MHQYFHEARDLEAEMLVVYRQKYRPLIEKLEQDYRYERGKFGKVIVVRYSPYKYIDI
jgi:hypothetical protein